LLKNCKVTEEYFFVNDENLEYFLKTWAKKPISQLDVILVYSDPNSFCSILPAILAAQPNIISLHLCIFH